MFQSLTDGRKPCLFHLDEPRTDGQRRHDLHVCAAGPEAASTRPTETPRPPSPQHLLHLPAAVSFNAEEQHLL